MSNNNVRKAYILGAGGFAKEVERLLFLSNQFCRNQIMFVSKDQEIKASNRTISEELFSTEVDIERDYCFIAVGHPNTRQKIYKKFKLCKFPNIFYDYKLGPVLEKPSTFSGIDIGIGNIFCINSVVTCGDIKIGNFNIFNIDTCIAHDSKIGDFNTINPGVKISGNNTIGNKSLFGVNSCTIENVSIGDEIVVGAGATVIRDIRDSGVYVGVPARKIK